MNADPDAAGPGLNEALAVWAALGVVAAMVWITYARLPADVFYNVTGTGIRAGASRVLVLLGWPISHRGRRARSPWPPTATWRRRPRRLRAARRSRRRSPRPCCARRWRGPA